MNTQTRNYIVLVILLAILGAGVWFGYSWWQQKNIAAQWEAGFTVMADKQPSLDRSISFDPNFPDEARTIMETKITDVQNSLKEEPGNYVQWLDLAIHYKTIGDYEGARDIWEYVNIAAPAQSVSFLNLGDLYTSYIKDFEAAERNYKAALERNSAQAIIYMGLADLYHYHYKTDTSAAEDILKQGIDTIARPQNIDLVIALASYYKAQGRNADAIEQYTFAKELAGELSNSELQQQMQIQINALQ